jgi:hypothetical protein
MKDCRGLRKHHFHIRSIGKKKKKKGINILSKKEGEKKEKNPLTLENSLWGYH